MAVDAQLLRFSRLEVANEAECEAVHAVHYRGSRNRLDQLDPETATRWRPRHHRAKDRTRPGERLGSEVLGKRRLVDPLVDHGDARVVFAAAEDSEGHAAGHRADGGLLAFECAMAVGRSAEAVEKSEWR